MNLKNLLARTAIAAALAATAAAAHADLYQFTVTGGYTATWQLQSTIVPDVSDDGSDFGIGYVGGSFTGSLSNVADIYFYNANYGGGITILDAMVITKPLLFTDSPQLYTGTEDNPTFLLGTFAMTEYGGSGTYTLTVTNLSAAVPEPAPIALMLGGLGLVGVAAARRRKPEEAETV